MAHIHAILCSNLHLASQGRRHCHLLFPCDRMQELLVLEKFTASNSASVSIQDKQLAPFELLIYIPTKEKQLCPPTHPIGYAHLTHDHTVKLKTTESSFQVL